MKKIIAICLIVCLVQLAVVSEALDESQDIDDIERAVDLALQDRGLFGSFKKYMKSGLCAAAKIAKKKPKGC